MEKDTTFQPTICKQSKDMANSSEMVFDRLQNWGEQQRDKKAQNQQQAADHKEKSSTMVSTSSSSSSSSRHVEICYIRCISGAGCVYQVLAVCCL